jgi:hypothetical protein
MTLAQAIFHEPNSEFVSPERCLLRSAQGG